ncbi:MAG: hypothetical protein ACK5PF_02200, partial [bacterium]
MMCWGLKGALDVSALRLAWRSCALRHDILRTGFTGFEHGGVQYVQPDTDIPFVERDLRNLTAAAREAEASRLM